MVILPPDDPQLTWRGLVGFEDAGEAWRRPWRLPFRELAPVAVGHLADRARDAAGVRLDVTVDGDLIVMLRGEAESPVDVTVNGVLVDRFRVRGETKVRTRTSGRARVQVWLPQFGHVEVGPVCLGRPPAPVPVEPRWVAYGSSITQCRGAEGPSQTWPALVARERRWDVTALGFGGECHLDPIAATTIALRPAELLSFCVGVNIHGHTTFSERTLLPAIVGFLDVARAGRSAPALLVGPIISPPNEGRENAVGLTLSRVREIVRDAADAAEIAYADGRELLGPDDTALLADGVHPTPGGYRHIARRMSAVLGSLLQ